MTEEQKQQPSMALVATPTADTALVLKVATAMKSSPESAQKAIARYGSEIVEAALTIKNEMLTVTFNALSKIVEAGLDIEQAKTIYLTKAEAIDYDRENNLKVGVSLRQLTKLAVRFPDFKEMDVDGQFELIHEICGVFGWQGSFRSVVDRIIARADELGFGDLDSLMQAGEELVRGEIHRTYFEDHEWEEEW